VGGEADLDTNECQAAELADGALMLNMRSYRGKGCRAVQTSADGGLTWSTVVDDRTLVDPVCQASLLRHPASGRSRLLFANAADTLHRRRMTVRLSYDEGRTWPYAKTIHYGPAAYSSLTALKDGSVGLLYEKDDYRSLAFARFTLEWLTDGKDRI
jgi:sialidase-1